jgi:hypothetical protein
MAKKIPEAICDIKQTKAIIPNDQKKDKLVGVGYEIASPYSQFKILFVLINHIYIYYLNFFILR